MKAEIVQDWVDGTEEDIIAFRQQQMQSAEKNEDDKLSFDDLTLRDDGELRTPQQDDDGKPQIVVVHSESLAAAGTTCQAGLHKQSCRQREGNFLLDQINYMRHISYKKIEESQSVYF